MPYVVDNRGKAETIKVKPTFRVEVLVGDRWIVLQDAQALSQGEAHVVAHQESQTVGQHRVRMMPNSR